MSTDHPYGYGAGFMFQSDTRWPQYKSIGVDDMCLTEAQKCEKAEADFMKQIDETIADGKFGAAILPAETYLRLQCLHVAEKQVGLMPKEVLEYAKQYYAFVAGK
jgi:hypothetical protein